MYWEAQEEKTGVGTRKMNKMNGKKGTQEQKGVNKIKRRKHFCSCFFPQKKQVRCLIKGRGVLEQARFLVS